ncbi:MAG: imidazole glycerol phosphate synthase subunit HisH [Candidatus Hermodarchaeota archaeon]
MITIVNFGMGNLGSIHNMLIRLGFDAKITSDIDEIKSAEKLILPGVGAFDQAMTNLHNQEFVPLLNDLVLKKRRPILGICLGMQLLAQRSEEGKLDGLGWIDAEVIRFRFSSEQNLRIPHIGWNTITIQQEACLFKRVYEESRFYFVHSYYVKCKSADTVLATTNYGFDFASAVVHDNIYGVQFHPEKSHKFGMLLLKNYAEFC